ncbi:MAG: L,D-transpeptidase family protein [Sphingomonas bacterium]|nr:L,D-transpeptidase family protein [Sphingomonas bacterium]
MNKLAFALAAPVMLALAVPVTPATATVETFEAKLAASEAAVMARADMADAFGGRALKPGHYLWKDGVSVRAPRVVISLSHQLAYLYSANELVAVSTISSGKSGHDTPTGIFPILQKKSLHHSRKYDNAPMPYMQRLDDYGIALHAGALPGRPASHGCVRLPAKFAAKLYGVTKVGSTVMIGA